MNSSYDNNYRKKFFPSTLLTRILLPFIFVIFLSSCPEPMPEPIPELKATLPACSLEASDQTHLKISNNSGRELILYTGGSADGALRKIPDNSVSCFVEIPNISNPTPVRIRFYDAADVRGDLDPGEASLFYNTSVVIRQNLLRPHNIVIPELQREENSGTIILTYTDQSHFVSVYPAPAGASPVCPALSWFRDNTNYITVMSSITGAEEIPLLFADTAQFMFAYWRDSELAVVGCTVSSLVHTVSASNIESTETIPAFTPDFSMTGRITIYNDDPSERPIRVRIATSDLHAHAAVIEPKDTSVIPFGSNKTFTMNIGVYSFVAYDGGGTTTLREERRITITSESTTTPIVWRVNDDIND